MKTASEFYSSYNGKALLKKHGLSDIGTWHIRGEDPNADFGGHHHMPTLGYRTGTLRDVVEEAVDMKDFWTWGSGGDITLIDVKKSSASTAKRRKELQTKVADLEKALQTTKKELENLQ